MTMSDGRSSIAFAAPSSGISSQGTPELAGHGSGDTIVVSAGPAAASQQSDAVDQTIRARASSLSRVPSEEDGGWTRIRKSRKGENQSSPRGSPSDPRSADQQLNDDLRKAQRKAEVQMSEAAEQHGENNALKEECASFRSFVKSLESDEAGSLQRILGLDRMNHTLESQAAHVHGRPLLQAHSASSSLKLTHSAFISHPLQRDSTVANGEQ